MKIILRIWRSKITTAVFLAAGAAAMAASLLLTFGPPSATKVIARLLFLLLFFGHFLSVYPKQSKRLLLGTEGRVWPGRERAAASKRPSGLGFYIVTGSILAASFFARAYRVTTWLTVDESKWLVFRVPTFFTKLTELSWHELLISDKPGITLAWLTGLGFLFTDKEGNGLYLSDPGLLLNSRAPLIIANVLLLLALALLVKKATGSRPAAILCLALTATNPTIMGMSPIVNPDSLSWFFPLATVLTFYLYLRDRRPWDLLLCSLIFAGGVLNKFNTLIALPFLPVLAVLFYVFSAHRPKDFFKFAAAGVVRLYALAAIISTVLWPYLLLAPQQYLMQTVLRPVIKPLFPLIIISLLIFWFFGDRLQDFLATRGPAIKRVILISVPLLSLTLMATTIRLTPGLPSIEKATKVTAPFGNLLLNNYYYHIYSQTTLTFLIYALACLIILASAWRPAKTDSGSALSILSLLFILFYLAGSAATGHITSPRYQIPVFPAVALLGAQAFVLVIDKVRREGMVTAAAGAVAIANLALVLPFAPYYLFYHNHLLPPGKLVFDGWGLGGYEAAQYLNNLPDAKNIRVFASYGGFDNFFVGQSLRRDEDPFDPPVDYFVVFKQGEKRFLIGNDPIKDKYWRSSVEPEYQFVVNDVPIVKVVKYKKP